MIIRSVGTTPACSSAPSWRRPGGRSTPLGSTHTRWSDCQLDAVAVLLRRRRQDVPRVVLMGDLNATPDSPAVIPASPRGGRPRRHLPRRQPGRARTSPSGSPSWRPSGGPSAGSTTCFVAPGASLPRCRPGQPRRGRRPGPPARTAPLLLAIRSTTASWPTSPSSRRIRSGAGHDSHHDRPAYPAPTGRRDWFTRRGTSYYVVAETGESARGSGPPRRAARAVDGRGSPPRGAPDPRPSAGRRSRRRASPIGEVRLGRWPDRGAPARRALPPSVDTGTASSHRSQPEDPSMMRIRTACGRPRSNRPRPVVGGSRRPDPQARGHAALARQGEATNLDPHKVPAFTSYRVFELVYSGLTSDRTYRSSPTSRSRG